MRAARLLMALLVLLTVPQRTAAQEMGEGEAVTDEQRAVEMFQISERLYSEGRYDQALQYLQQAHALRPSPTLLYNMARTNEKLDRLEEAVGAYEAYLGTTTDPGDREQAELRIRTLRAEIAERDALRDRRSATDPMPVTPDDESTGWADNWKPEDPLGGGTSDEQDSDSGSTGSIVPWVLIGAGVPTLGIGLALYLVATGKHDDAVAATTSQKSAFELQSEGEDLMLVGNILVGLGAAAAVTGGVLLVLELTGEDSEDSGSDVAQRPLHPVVGPGYLGFAGSF